MKELVNWYRLFLWNTEDRDQNNDKNKTLKLEQVKRNLVL